VQRIFQLNAYKLNRELVTGLPMTAEMLASEYSSKVRVSSGETVSIGYAYSAISVYNQIFKDDVARALVLKAPLCIHLLWRPRFAFTHMYTCTRMHTMHAHTCPIPSFWQADEEFGKKTPWDSVTKLEWVYKKAGKSTVGIRERCSAHKDDRQWRIEHHGIERKGSWWRAWFSRLGLVEAGRLG